MVDDIIRDELLTISGAGVGMVFSATYSGVMHSEDNSFELPIVVYVDTRKDYNTNTSDYKTISFLLPLGDFIHFFYPNKDNLEIELTNKVLGLTHTHRYKLIITAIDKDISNNTYSRLSYDKMNEAGMTKVLAQCLNPTAETLRAKNISGVYRGVSILDVMSSLMQTITSDVLIQLTTTPLDINIIQPNNTRVYDNIIIPDSVNVLDLPSYLQDKYGVYNGGLGTYLNNNGETETLYVYPLYRNNMLAYTKKRLQITSTSDLNISSVDSTYAMDGDTLKILVSALTSTVDDSGESSMRDKGNSIRVIEAESVMNRPVSVSEDEVVYRSEDVNRRTTHHQLRSQTSKYENHATATNSYVARSSVLKNAGRVIQVEWTNSNARLLYPGMGVNYMIEETGVVNSYTGTLQAVHVATENETEMEVSVLVIHVDITPTIKIDTNVNKE